MIDKLLRTSKGNIFYRISEKWDPDADTLFFMHGLTADHSMFDMQVSFFENDCNVIVWDAPAHGLSRPFKPFSFRNAADCILKILDTLEVNRAVLIGQSLGGYFAQSFIKYYPGRVKGFISIDSTPYGKRYYSKADIWLINQVGRMAYLYPSDLLKTAIAKQVSTTRRACENMMQMLEPYEKKELCRLMTLGYSGFLSDNCDLNITCPVLLISGEKDKTGKVRSYNRKWAKNTGYPLMIIKDAAHNSNVDKPDEVNECIRVFLSKLK